MEEFVKTVTLPLLIALGVLTSCFLSMCYYQYLKYYQEKRMYAAQLRKDAEGDISGEDELILSEKSESQEVLPIETTTVALPVQPPLFKTVEDIQQYLSLKDISLDAMYNREHGFLQLCVSTLRLYPLPKGIGGKFLLQYKVYFTIPDSMTLESDAKPLRQQVRFEEKYRLYHSLQEVEDSEMRIDIYAVEAFLLKPFFLWPVKYVLKPTNAFRTDPDREFNREDIRIDCVRQVDGHEVCPKVLVSLCYKPTSGRIQLRLVQGADFPVTAHDKRLRVTILQTKHGNVRSFLTPVLERCDNPQIDEAFVLGISVSNVETAMLTVSLLCGIKTNSLEAVAETKIGNFSPFESGRQHWDDMLTTVRNDIEMWHQMNFV